MRAKLGVPAGREEETWRPLFQKYNQSLRALKAGGFHILEDEYWDCLRAGAEDYLMPDRQVQWRLLLKWFALRSLCVFRTTTESM